MKLILTKEGASQWIQVDKARVQELGKKEAREKEDGSITWVQKDKIRKALEPS